MTRKALAVQTARAVSFSSLHSFALHASENPMPQQTKASPLFAVFAHM
jgi:hypothetical protein